MTESQSKTKSFMLENDNIDDIKATLNQGGLILLPTDTVWSIGCDATNPAAIQKLAQLKRREQNNGFIVLVDTIETLKNYVDDIHPRIDTLLVHHTRPLTVVFNTGKNLPSEIFATDQSLALRVVKDEFCQALIAGYGKPIVVSSANISGQSYPANFGEVSSAIIQGVDYIFKRRRYEKDLNEPSVIIRAEGDGELEFIRE